MSILPPTIKFIPELFDFVQKLSDRSEKIQALREFSMRDEVRNKTLEGTLRYVFHPAIILEIPPGTPPSMKSPEYPDYDVAPLPLIKVFRMKLPRLSKISPYYIDNVVNRERFFVRTLEALYGRHAELVIQIKDKKLSEWPSLKKDLFKEAFPEWFKWDEETEEAEGNEEPPKPPRKKPGPKPGTTRKKPGPKPGTQRKKPGPKPGSRRKKSTPTSDENTNTDENS